MRMFDQTTRLSETGQGRLLEELLKERGFAPGDYALFLTTDEGRYLPSSTSEDEVEEISGYLVDRSGNHYLFWLGWDPEKQAPALTHWDAVEPQPHWRQSGEYLSALEDVGLDMS